MSLYYLETGDFRSLSMTRQGQVLIDAKPQVFSSNGQVAASTRLQPWHMGAQMLLACVQDWQLDRLVNTHPHYHLQPIPLNMDLPLLEIIVAAVLRPWSSGCRSPLWPSLVPRRQPMVVRIPAFSTSLAGVITLTPPSNKRLTAHVLLAEGWARHVEIFAPGYLALETQGLEAEFELTCLSDHPDSYEFD
ncbi:hypothetical protein BO82DRAFT_434882 [Aspergillus uvarum CBS 121591]|uniref:Uncharacterized protein n=1 Tax=Aspergillus uvarum CBS 121591 TaxID=1448315 RepID=A0A319BY59_9EURO|nr:hypothetical protein BO82DRAFT_434882 [Aspergillus uvarum CBS 121591]PYH78656.1 hypothetical protein BO82DRAFT_434882 [Aspergillus uvarum CBS 121591]